VNFLALNLARDIMTDERAIEDAREAHAEMAKNLFE
jgi:hypothetical protein